MNPSVCCYPQEGKPKAFAVATAFAQGCPDKATIYCKHPPKLGAGSAFFYGARPAFAHLWEQAKAEGREWYYADNSYFDVAREVQFRVTRNAVQHCGFGKSDGKRLKALGVEIKPWRRGGHIVVCAQSAEFMQTVAMEPDWPQRTVSALQSITDRQIVLRAKHDGQLAEALRGAHAVVTWGSAAAVEAVCAGVPVVCSEACAAWPMSTPLDEIEDPRWPDGREEWAAVLADNQWSLEEMRRGECWRALNG